MQESDLCSQCYLFGFFYTLCKGLFEDLGHFTKCSLARHFIIKRFAIHSEKVPKLDRLSTVKHKFHEEAPKPSTDKLL